PAALYLATNLRCRSTISRHSLTRRSAREDFSRTISRELGMSFACHIIGKAPVASFPGPAMTGPVSLRGSELVAQGRPCHAHIGAAPGVARWDPPIVRAADHYRGGVAETVVKIFAAQQPIVRNHPFETAACHPATLGVGEFC